MAPRKWSRRPLRNLEIPACFFDGKAEFPDKLPVSAKLGVILVLLNCLPASKLDTNRRSPFCGRNLEY